MDTCCLHQPGLSLVKPGKVGAGGQPGFHVHIRPCGPASTSPPAHLMPSLAKTSPHLCSHLPCLSPCTCVHTCTCPSPRTCVHTCLCPSPTSSLHPCVTPHTPTCASILSSVLSFAYLFTHSSLLRALTQLCSWFTLSSIGGMVPNSSHVQSWVAAAVRGEVHGTPAGSVSVNASMAGDLQVVPASSSHQMIGRSQSLLI